MSATRTLFAAGAVTAMIAVGLTGCGTTTPASDRTGIVLDTSGTTCANRFAVLNFHLCGAVLGNGKHVDMATATVTASDSNSAEGGTWCGTVELIVAAMPPSLPHTRIFTSEPGCSHLLTFGRIVTDKGTPFRTLIDVDYIPAAPVSSWCLLAISNPQRPIYPEAACGLVYAKAAA
jgi:hypothetical protein